MNTERRSVAKTCLCELDHPRALVERDDLSPSSQELLCVQAGPTTRIKNQLPVDVAEQVQHCGPVIQRVVRANRSMPLEVCRAPLVDRTHKPHYRPNVRARRVTPSVAVIVPVVSLSQTRETATPWSQPTSSRRSAGRTSRVSTAQTNRSDALPAMPEQ